MLFECLICVGDCYVVVLVFDYLMLLVVFWLNVLVLCDVLVGCMVELDFVGYSCGGFVIVWLLCLVLMLLVC